MNEQLTPTEEFLAIAKREHEALPENFSLEHVEYFGIYGVIAGPVKAARVVIELAKSSASGVSSVIQERLRVSRNSKSDSSSIMLDSDTIDTSE